MQLLLSFIIDGFVVGMLYALVALGFVLLYKMSGIINFAQGEFVMMGGYAAVMMTLAGVPFWLVFILTIVAAAIFGMVVERIVARPMIGEDVIAIIMATIGLAAVLRGLAPMLWGADTKAFPGVFPTSPILIFGVPIGLVNIYAVGFAVLFVALFWAFFKFTRIGVAMQAVADDQQAAQSMGISVKTVFAYSWAIAGIVAAVGGILWGNLVGVDAFLAFLGLKVFPVVILGGLESIGGAIVGGIIIGVLENLAAGYIDPLVGGGVKDVAPFVILVIVLMVRPYGLFGRPMIRRV